MDYEEWISLGRPKEHPLARCPRKAIPENVKELMGFFRENGHSLTEISEKLAEYGYLNSLGKPFDKATIWNIVAEIDAPPIDISLSATEIQARQSETMTCSCGLTVSAWRSWIPADGYLRWRRRKRFCSTDCQKNRNTARDEARLAKKTRCANFLCNREMPRWVLYTSRDGAKTWYEKNFCSDECKYSDPNFIFILQEWHKTEAGEKQRQERSRLGAFAARKSGNFNKKRRRATRTHEIVAALNEKVLPLLRLVGREVMPFKPDGRLRKF